MIIKIMAVDLQGECRSFNIMHDDLEVTYGVLSSIAQHGDTLVNVTLVDKRGCLPLPLDALEKLSFLNPISVLRQQWEEVLAQPMQNNLVNDGFGQRLIGLREDRRLSARRSLHRVQALFEQIQPKQESEKQGPEKAALMSYYLRLMDIYSRVLIQLETDACWLKLLQDIA